MMTKWIKLLSSAIALLALSALSSAAIAAEKITASTTGMTCEACANTVKTKFLKSEAVDTVEVDIETGTVIVTLKEGARFSDQEVEDVVTWAGYEIKTLDRSES